jgi:hypothetical protein
MPGRHRALQPPGRRAGLKTSQRLAVGGLVAAALLLAGLLFWPFILESVIKPVALVAWLLLRMLVLSIDQHYLWFALIFVAGAFLLRVLFHTREAEQPDVYLETSATQANIEFWRTRFAGNPHNAWDEKTLKKDLLYLLVSFYASNRNTSVHVGIYQDLELGVIPLPGTVHDFLFPPEPRQPEHFLARLLRSARETPRKWIRRWTGQEQADQYRRIAEVLTFIETSLENKHDAANFAHNES